MALIVTAVNVSGLDNVSDYVIEVRVNSRVIASGYVKGHTRADGWRALLQRIASSANVEDEG